MAERDAVREEYAGVVGAAMRQRLRHAPYACLGVLGGLKAV